MLKKLLSLVCLLAVLTTLFSCSFPAVGGETNVPQIESFSILGEDTIEVEVNGEYKLQTNLTAEEAAYIKWSASSDIVMITEDGCILGLSVGACVVQGEISGLSDAVTVNVVAEKQTPPAGGGTENDPLAPSPIYDPYANMDAEAFYQNYTPAKSYWDAYHRSRHYFMSGNLETPDQEPTVSAYRPTVDGQYLRNTSTYYSESGNAYTVVDVYGAPMFTVYYGGAYITLDEVVAYVFAFGDVPANYSSDKDDQPKLTGGWGKYLRVNHSSFTGNKSKYPYQPILPNISGCGGNLRYMELDIGTTGTDCDPKFPDELYNNGSKIVRGAARIVYGKSDLDGDGVLERGEHHVFYTYNHYNDFQEYLNYYGGWGEMFGNITGGGTISSKSHYNPTPYVEVYFDALPSVGDSVASVVFVLPAVYERKRLVA